MFYFMDSGPKFTGLLSPNAGRSVLSHISFHFWLSWLVPEIFRIKVRNCV